MNMKEYLKKYTKQSKKGFTMVELITVIVIMSIISTATVSIFLSVQTTVRDTSKLTTQQYTTTQMEKFIRNELQTASKIDVHDLNTYPFGPNDLTLEKDDEFMYYDGGTQQLTFMITNESGNANPKLIIDEVEDVTFDICPVDFEAADPDGLAFKCIYKVHTTNYDYSGGIVLGNSCVGDEGTFESASMMFGGNVAHVHWDKDDSDGDNGKCITFHSLGTQNPEAATP